MVDCEGPRAGMDAVGFVAHRFADWAVAVKRNNLMKSIVKGAGMISVESKATRYQLYRDGLWFLLNMTIIVIVYRPNFAPPDLLTVGELIGISMKNRVFWDVTPCNALVRTDVSEDLSAFFIRVTRIGELGTTLAVINNRSTLRRANILLSCTFL
jgi:hypothetical protein